MSLIFYAPNVCRGGGLTLMRPLLKLLAQRKNVRFILDDRLTTKDKAILENSAKVKYIKSSLASRLVGEWHLRTISKPEDTIFCFANLPPLLPSKAKHIILFVQNRNALGINSLREFTFKVACRVFLERLWFKCFLYRATSIVCQTETMRQLFSERFPRAKNLSVLNFVPEELLQNPTDFSVSPNKKYDFLYIATADRHKQHRQLIDAWCLLAKENLKPSLVITIDANENPALYSHLEDNVKKYSLNIINKGYCSHQEALDLYPQSRALIFPSVSETIGLPLLEAKQAGLPILASERDFVRDMVVPVETFDPCSSLSIARAVKRFLGIEAKPIQSISAKAFAEIILRDDS